MSKNSVYRAILSFGKTDTLYSLTATADGTAVTLYKPELIKLPGPFGVDAQVKEFEKGGYDVYVQQRSEYDFVISAIPQNARLNHATWMQFCADAIKGDA